MSTTPPELSAAQVSEWLRQKAVQLNQMADTLDVIYNSNSTPAGLASTWDRVQRAKSALPIVPGSEVITVNAAAIKSAIRLRGMRVGDLSDHFQTDPATINAIITADPSLEVGDRGWVRERKP